MMLALAAAAVALNPVERLYLSHGHRANSFSAAFDPDLERHVTDEGFVAFARHECTRTSLAFFDPVCLETNMETVLDSFMERERQRGRVAFWKVLVSRGVAPTPPHPPTLTPASRVLSISSLTEHISFRITPAHTAGAGIRTS